MVGIQLCSDSGMGLKKRVKGLEGQARILIEFDDDREYRKRKRVFKYKKTVASS